MSLLLCIKVKADNLKDIVVGGRRTKVVAVGIGSLASLSELISMASAPLDRNVIRTRDFSSLHRVEEYLRNASCTGLLLVVCIIHVDTTLNK